MGCDIHAMIEAKRRYEYLPNAWSWQSCGRIAISRDYRLFAVLADVRNYHGVKPIAKPRLNYEMLTKSDHNDEYVSQDFWLWARDYGVDGHSHSFVTLDELETADTHLAAKCRLIALAHGLSDARLVFFFDN